LTVASCAISAIVGTVPRGDSIPAFVSRGNSGANRGPNEVNSEQRLTDIPVWGGEALHI